MVRFFNDKRAPWRSFRLRSKTSHSFMRSFRTLAGQQVPRPRPRPFGKPASRRAFSARANATAPPSEQPVFRKSNTSSFLCCPHKFGQSHDAGVADPRVAPQRKPPQGC